jgi:hypothetical protein
MFPQRCIGEWSQEEQSEEHVHSKVKGGPTAEEVSGDTTPYLAYSQKSEESPQTPFEFSGICDTGSSIRGS